MFNLSTSRVIQFFIRHETALQLYGRSLYAAFGGHAWRYGLFDGTPRAAKGWAKVETRLLRSIFGVKKKDNDLVTVFITMLLN